LARARKKIDSTLLAEIAPVLLDSLGASADRDRPLVRLDVRHRALVEVRATVTADLEAAVRRLDSVFVASSAQYSSLVAWILLEDLEGLAARDDVRAIVPAPEARTH
jgi:hypothetical protein